MRQFQWRRPVLEHVADRRVRAVVDDLAGGIEGLQGLLRDLVTVERGRVAIKGAFVPREVPADPTAKSTAGLKGEVVVYDNSLYRNVGTTERPAWVAM